MKNMGFEGWYFKHQKGDTTVAFIPGRAESGAFVQVVGEGGSRQFEVPFLRGRGGVLYAGDCTFSRRGAVIRLPGIQGELTYGPLSPLRSDIMGPFCAFPMECRHGVVSMTHSVRGAVTAGGRVQRFDGGLGYIEKDCGTSFPSSYLWLQCNDFPVPCSIMLSIARIPFAGAHFTGCICAILAGEREYRLATYCGVRIRSGGPEHIALEQGRLRLRVDVAPSDGGHLLRAPVRGKMSGTIRESSNAAIHVRLWEGNRPVLDTDSSHAVYEYVPGTGRL